MNPETQSLPYLNAQLPIEDRVNDLLQRMTLEEKVGQMCQYVFPKDVSVSGDPPAADADDFSVQYTSEERQVIPDLIRRGCIGSILSETDPERLNALQRLASNSRLGVPLLFATDAIHGNAMHTGSAVYPAPISLAATWDCDLAERIARATALELRASNLHWTFSPNVDVARDGRWGRFGETFGEDPYLIGELGKAMVRGYQGDLSNPNEQVLACAKHFIAGGEPPNGINIASMDLSERALREVFLPPFQAAVEAGVETVMAAHNDVNGIPCHGNFYLMTEVLRDELGFKGFIVSDWTDIPRLFTLHRVATSVKEADRMAVESGIDMHMHGPGFLEPICEEVRAGTLPEFVIDAAARRILTAKFRLGLFEHLQVEPPPTPVRPENQALALEAARKSIILLRNEDQLLPLSPTRGPILVTGPNAHNQSILGDWVMPQPPENIVTVLDGIRALAGSGTAVTYYDCGDLLAIGEEQIQQAAQMAAQAAVAVVVVGENPLRYTKTKTEGENVDRSDLDLPGQQLQLVQAIAATGTPVVMVLVNGRPLSIPWVEGHIPAIVEALHPGMQGGQAVAEVLFGVTNPSGRLPFTVPYTVGQIRAIYNHRPSDYFRKYRLTPNEPLYPFGFGLSYTRFAYSHLQVPAQVISGEPAPVQVEVTNIGDRAGDEAVLLYLHDSYSSVTTPVRQIQGFQRVHLEPGQTQTVHFTLQPDQLALYNARMQRVIEPGEFEIYVADQTAAFEVVD